MSGENPPPATPGETIGATVPSLEETVSAVSTLQVQMQNVTSQMQQVATTSQLQNLATRMDESMSRLEALISAAIQNPSPTPPVSTDTQTSALPSPLPPTPPPPLSPTPTNPFDEEEQASGRGDASYFQSDSGGQDARRVLSSVKLNPHLPRDGTASARRTTIIHIGDYTVETDEIVEPATTGQLNATQIKPPYISEKQLTATSELIRFRDAYFAYVVKMKRFGQSFQTIRELMGPKCLLSFNNLYLHFTDANGTPDATSVGDGDIVRAINTCAEAEKENKAKDLIPTLKEKLKNVWNKGPTAKRTIKHIINEIFLLVSQHLGEYGRMDLYRCPVHATREEQQRFKGERKQLISAVWNAFPKHLRETVKREMGTDDANGFQDDPHKVLTWLQNELPRFYNIYSAGISSARSKQSNPSSKQNSGSPARSQANMARTKQPLVQRPNVKCKMGHPFLSKESPPPGKTYKEMPWVQNCPKKLSDAAQLVAREKALKQIENKQKQAAKKTKTSVPTSGTDSSDSPPATTDNQPATPATQSSQPMVPYLPVPQTQFQSWPTQQWTSPPPGTQMAPGYGGLTPPQASGAYGMPGGSPATYPMLAPPPPSPYGPRPPSPYGPRR